MCVAILTKPGAVLTPDQIKEGWSCNPDGGGFAYVRDDKVQIVKGFMKVEHLVESYKAMSELYAEDSPFLVHMRIGTSGGKTPKNTHPFPIKNGALIHNGIMFTPAGERAGTPEDRKSDTRVFAEALYNVLELEHVKKAEKRILREIGYYNKVCFLYNDKSYYILNEDAGDWEGDIWFSNSSCKPSRRYNYSGTNGGKALSDDRVAGREV